MRGRSWHEEVSTVFGIGHLRPAPGTWGSLAALPPALLIMWLFGFWGLLLAILAVTGIGVLSSGHHAARIGRKDPSEVVIDEVAGQWIATLPLALFAGWSLWYGWVAAFALFRLFDVIKPWPCDDLERLPGGQGVMCDDLMAGLYAALAMTLLLFLVGPAHV